MWHGGGGTMVQYCRKRLNLPLTTCRQYNDRVDKMPWLYGFSSSVIPLPLDWPGNVKIAGFLFLTAQDSGTLSLDPDMESFIAAQPDNPPIYVGFGSMPTGLTKRFFALIDELLKESGPSARFIIYVGGTNLSSEAPETETDAVRRYHEAWKATGRVYLAMSTSHDLLFPRCRVIVHPGGAGTTASALKSKKPQVVCPFFADQPFWASKMGELGVAPLSALTFRKVTGKAMWSAIKSIDREPAITKAKETGHVIASEDAAREAASWLLRNLILLTSR
jgi:UDP:flavonoid glycosyltransferase YjiC (YdhE family)